MADVKKLLKHRAEAKKRKPTFNRTEYHKRGRLQKSGWRRPTGFHSKLRQYHKSKGKRVRIGYKMPEEVRGLHKSGKQFVYVTNLNDLKSVDKQSQLVVISHTLGQRKTIELINQAKKIGIEIYNFDAEVYLKKVEKRITDRKEEKKKRVERREKKKVKKKEAKPAESKSEEKKAEPSEKEEKKEDEPKKEIKEGPKKIAKTEEAKK